LSLGLEDAENLPTLREFINTQKDVATDVYSYALPVSKDSELHGKTIRSSGLREQYDCMILGLQRNKLPILKPDINMVLQTDDLVWVLGSRRMIEKLLASNLSEA
jgi:CPA2 family monovalent cation:H+ antiporter-2